MGAKIAKTKAKRRWRRRLAIAAGAAPALVLALWLAVHHIPGFGPLVADTLRAILGAKAVAWMEDTAYGLEDWLNRRLRASEPPEPAWEIPAEVPAAASAAAPADGADGGTADPPFTLADVGPMHDNVMTKGDGVWLPLRDPRAPDDRVRMLKTFLHPDGSRSWSIVVIVAVDLGHATLHAVAGRFEPVSATKEAKAYERKAVIPKEHHDSLLAAFNGGYKSTHGDYGMKIDGVVLTPPRPLACAIAMYPDERLVIRPWEAVESTADQMVWLRQTPICMVDEGKPHPGLSMPTLGWGASAVSGTTVIRRSAIGLGANGRVLYVAIGDFLTGATIARAMQHAGAQSVAQLDVNFSFPKFFTYRFKTPGSAELEAVPLTDKFEYVADEYIGTRAHRDFFYLTRRDPDRR